jgi:hypothetical protein
VNWARIHVPGTTIWQILRKVCRDALALFLFRRAPSDAVALD